MEYHDQSACMELCEKLGGRSASVVTLKEWTNLFNEIQLITPNVQELPDYIWLSATEGDKQNQLVRPDHWPEGIEAQEGDWRDYYSGQNLDNYTKPWFSINSDTEEGDHSNCLSFSPQQTLQRSWKEWQCDTQSFAVHALMKLPPSCTSEVPVLKLIWSSSDTHQCCHRVCQVSSLWWDQNPHKSDLMGI